MKKLLLPIAGVMLIGAATLAFLKNSTEVEPRGNLSAQTDSDSVKVELKGKILVTYFSWPETDGVDANSSASRVVEDGKVYGNTEFLAKLISEKTGGDLFAIKTATVYPMPYDTLLSYTKKETENEEFPKLTTHIQNLQDYNIIFVGYPNWWYDMPRVIYSFFKEYDFKGKTIIPFVTYGSSRFSKSVEHIRALEPGAAVLEGPAVKDADMALAEKKVDSWLLKYGLYKN